MTPAKKNPRSGYYNGTITMVNGEWFRQMPADMRRQLLRNITDTANDTQEVTWIIRASGQHWDRVAS